MAKTILFDYTFDASAKTITVTDTYDQKRFLLITNVNTGDIIYNFADSAKGASFEYTYEPTPSTVLTLNYDTTSMADTDPLQIFYDSDAVKIEPSSTFLDPVSKIRVSTPENLIDTDFEYGLQSTKWETLENTANIPTFFSRSGEVSYSIDAMTISTNSDLVTVTTANAHSLQRGTPIIVVGTTQITCDGGFIVSEIVDDNTFVYRSKAVQNLSGSILEDNTFLYAAGLYSGTEFKVTGVGAITTDSATDSTLTANVLYPCNFTENTSFSISNSFANVGIPIDTDDVNLGSLTITNKTVTSSSTPNAGGNTASAFKTWAFDDVGRCSRSYNTADSAGWRHFFREGTSDIFVNITNDTIAFPDPHGLETNDAVVYSCGAFTTPIGGLTKNRAYFVRRVNAYAIRLSENTNVNSYVNLTSVGSHGGGSYSFFAQGVMVDYGYYRFTRIRRRWGSFTVRDSYMISYSNSNSRPHATMLGYNYNDPGIVYLPAYTSNTNDHVTTLYANLYNQGYSMRESGRGTQWLYYRGQGNTTSNVLEGSSFTSGGDLDLGSPNVTDVDDFFILPIGDAESSYVSPFSWVVDENQYVDTIRVDNHGFSTGDVVEVTLSGGTYSPLTSGDFYEVQVFDSDHFKLLTTDGTLVRLNVDPSPNITFSFSTYLVDSDGDTLAVASGSEQPLADGKAFDYVVPAGGTAIGGLVDGTEYYMARVAGTRFNVSTTPNHIDRTINFFHSNVSSTNNTITIPGGNLSTGDAVIYNTVSGTTLTGLKQNQLYFVRAINTSLFKLYVNSLDATNDTNAIPIARGSTNLISSFRVSNIVDLTSKPASSEAHSLGINAIGAADGVYRLGTLATDKLSFTMNAGFSVLPRSLNLVAQQSFIASLDGFFKEDHGLVTGDIAEISLTGNTNISGITSGNNYYIIGDSNQFFRLAATYQDALDGMAIGLSETSSSSVDLTGVITIKADTIVGKFSGEGTVSFEDNFYTLTGEGTRFTSYFINGDEIEIDKSPITLLATKGLTTDGFTVDTNTNEIVFTDNPSLSNGDPIVFSLNGASFLPSPLEEHTVYYVRVSGSNRVLLYYTALDAIASTNRIDLLSSGSSTTFQILNFGNDRGSIIKKTIDYVNSANKITVVEPFDETLTDTKFLLRTRLLLRNDGFALHRPYDGGVELIPSTNPDSQMIRQTRKYFRYQSGKGIQVSFAVNFSPSTQIETFTTVSDTDSETGQTITVGTIKTRYPHRMSEGLNITTKGATNSVDTIRPLYTVVTINNSQYEFDGTPSNLLASEPLLRGRTYRFIQEDSTNTGGTLRFSTTEDGTNNGGVEYTTGVTVNGTAGTSGAYTEITIDANAPDTLYIYNDSTSNYSIDLSVEDDAINNSQILYNDIFSVSQVIDPYKFEVILAGEPTEPKAKGSVEFYVNSWQNSQLKCGLFDDQNGIYFEYDGQDLYACRRSATKQLSGYNNVTFRSGTITGVDTAYLSQLVVGERIVIRGQVYEVVRIDSDTQFNVLPSYRGKTSDRVIISKIETVKTPQSQWNIDKADGTGKSGFKLDINKIQMAYIDYSWYGAGKVRFGFKDQNGDVKYVHSYAHGNYLTEAYMRSGNVPARYEIQNVGKPTYVPALAHWGTSVIMDGRFDPDRAYIFNGNSQTTALTSSPTTSITGDTPHIGYYYYKYNNNWVPIGYAIEVSPNAAYNGFVQRDPISGTNLPVDTELANPFFPTGYQQPYQINLRTRTSQFNKDTQEARTLLLINKAPTSTATGVTYTIGSGTAIEVTKRLPLVSLRLAPSVDNSNTGSLGAREIVNRMQLILNSTTILTTHAVQIDLVLNGTLNTNNWQSVTRPSLSEIQLHSAEDTIEAGESVFNFRCQGDTGTTRAEQLTEQNLEGIATLGNAIMGGDNVFPDGPDVLTLVATLIEDPSTVTSATPFVINARVGWSESQA